MRAAAAAPWLQAFQPIVTDMAFLLATHYQHAMAMAGAAGAGKHGTCPPATACML
jgi:hypothetical protein